MEIINYVQEQPRQRKFSLPVFERREKSHSSAASYQLYSTELKTFSVKKVHNPVSVKTVFMEIGRALSSCQTFISNNKTKVAVGFFILLGLGFAGICSIFGVQYYLNHTGPVKMQLGDTLDIENLNKMMSNFALAGTPDYDESGKLIDSAVAVKVSYTQPVTYQTYKVRSGDTISGIAKKFGLTNISTLISVNDIGNVRQLGAGQKLRIPSIDGIVYTVKKGDSINSIITKYKISQNALLDVNELTTETLTAGQQLFLPGASMDAAALKNAMGELFRLPIAAKFRWSSPYGPRPYPLTGTPSFHTGTDMACPTGTPILAAMSGRVSYTGLSRVYGNYVIIEHGNGYQTLYAHMSKIIATKGQWVSQGTRIGLVGSTGQSTGPHLHFTVYKNGKTIDPMTVLK